MKKSIFLLCVYIKTKKYLCLKNRFSFSNNIQHCKTFWKINERNISRIAASKLLDFRFYFIIPGFVLTLKIIMYVSLKSFHKKKTDTLVWNSFEKTSRNSLLWVAVSKLIQHLCALTRTADVYQVWFTVALVHRNIQVAAIIINCIHLWQEIWELGHLRKMCRS